MFRVNPRDGTLAALVLLGGVVLNNLVYGSSGPLVLQVALALPLVWRRYAPFTVFCVVAAVALVQWAADVQTLTDLALLVALHTVAARSSRWHTLAAATVLEVGVLLAAARWAAPADRFLTSAAFLTAVLVAVAVTGVNTRIRRERAVRLESERDQRARLAVAEERGRIAREMHDIVTHNLSVMVALADAAVFAQRYAPERADVAMRQISGTGRQALTDMRRTLGVLRADEPDASRHPAPGLAQLEPLTAQMRAAGLSVQLDLEGDATAVPVAAQLTVYRLVQEALTNTFRHTPSGTRAAVRVRCDRDAVTVEVVDDGPPARVPDPSTGHGLVGMRERAAAYGGTLEAGPREGGGWRVAASLDLNAREAM
ncbi:sensor histidine kinase [Streptosporangium saharense]|uniref:histidine kinase n=1 Tax=Streptosporangium saharense TaxID=1706840 RepID=A0A7W7QNM7_9ACTN|nr:sensor histidine kinase [Streptosporangium saharense]MBB4916945.1 signal transduction histidine kinase [Streptosporangium saharense]